MVDCSSKTGPMPPNPHLPHCSPCWKFHGQVRHDSNTYPWCAFFRVWRLQGTYWIKLWSLSLPLIAKKKLSWSSPGLPNASALHGPLSARDCRQLGPLPDRRCSALPLLKSFASPRKSEQEGDGLHDEFFNHPLSFNIHLKVCRRLFTANSGSHQKLHLEEQIESVGTTP